MSNIEMTSNLRNAFWIKTVIYLNSLYSTEQRGVNSHIGVSKFALMHPIKNRSYLLKRYVSR